MTEPERQTGRFQSFYQNNDPKGGLITTTDWLRHDRVLLWFSYFSQENDPQKALLAAKLAQLLEVDPARSQGLINRITQTLASEAGQVNWPYRKLNCPIAELLNNGQITKRDLYWASHNAPHVQVREAARILLQLDVLHYQNSVQNHEPAQLHGSNSYSARQERLYILGCGIVCGIYLTLFACYLAWMSYSLLTHHKFPHFSTFAVIGLLGTMIVFYKSLNFTLNNSINHRRGRIAEEELQGFLQARLNHEWHLFSNLKLPNINGDFDLVLVHASAIYMIEVKAWRGLFQVDGDEWKVKRKGQWTRCRHQPTIQVKRNAVALKQYLQQKHIMVSFIQPVIVWLPITLDGDDKIEHPPELKLQSPSIQIVQRQDLINWIERLTQATQGNIPVDTVVQSLSVFCAKQNH